MKVTLTALFFALFFTKHIHARTVLAATCEDGRMFTLLSIIDDHGKSKKLQFGGFGKETLAECEVVANKLNELINTGSLASRPVIVSICRSDFSGFPTRLAKAVVREDKVEYSYFQYDAVGFSDCAVTRLKENKLFLLSRKTQ